MYSDEQQQPGFVQSSNIVNSKSGRKSIVGAK